MLRFEFRVPNAEARDSGDLEVENSYFKNT